MTRDYLREFAEEPLPPRVVTAIEYAGGTIIRVSWPETGMIGARVLTDPDVDWIANIDTRPAD